MSDGADNIIIKRTRRQRPPRLPESIDGYGFVGRHDDASRAPTRIEQTVAPPLTESPGVPLISDGGNGAEPEAVPTVPLHQGAREGKGNWPLQGGINKGTTNQLIEHSEKVAEDSERELRSGPLDVAIDRLKDAAARARKAEDRGADALEAFVSRLQPAFDIWDEVEKELDDLIHERV